MKKKYKYTAILTFVISLMMVVSVMFPMVTSAEDSMTSSTTDSTKTTETTEAKTETSTKSSTDSSSKDSSDEVEDSADELVEKESSPAFSSEKTVDGVKVKVTADANVFPEGTTMEVKKVNLTSSEKKLISLKQDSKQSTIKQYSFDITMKNKDGEEIEPDTSKGKIKVSFENELVKMLSTDVYHLVSSTKAETLKLTKSTNKVTGETSSFSTYVIDFTYDSSKIYYLYDDSSVLASKLLAQVLSSDATIDESKITKVMSNKDYITASESDPNTTDDVSEGATVTITYDGNDYTINVKYTKTDTKATDGTTDAWIKNFGYTTSGSTVTLKNLQVM